MIRVSSGIAIFKGDGVEHSCKVSNIDPADFHPATLAGRAGAMADIYPAIGGAHFFAGCDIGLTVATSALA